MIWETQPDCPAFNTADSRMYCSSYKMAFKLWCLSWKLFSEIIIDIWIVWIIGHLQLTFTCYNTAEVTQRKITHREVPKGDWWHIRNAAEYLIYHWEGTENITDSPF